MRISKVYFIPFLKWFEREQPYKLKLAKGKNINIPCFRTSVANLFILKNLETNSRHSESLLYFQSIFVHFANHFQKSYAENPWSLAGLWCVWCVLAPTYFTNLYLSSFSIRFLGIIFLLKEFCEKTCNNYLSKSYNSVKKHSSPRSVRWILWKMQGIMINEQRKKIQPNIKV